MQISGVEQAGFDMVKAKMKNPREVEVWVLKNRNGVVGSCILLDYYAAYNLFWEKNVPLPESGKGEKV